VLRCRSRLPELTLPYAALVSLGCGLVDSDGERRSAVSWCDEPANRDVAAVEIFLEDWDDGVAEVVTLFDANGLYIFKIDVAEDGKVLARGEATLDSAGRISVETGDDADDGTIDGIKVTTYDDDGRPVFVSWDFENDGKIDRAETRSYTPTEERRFVDPDGDGDEAPEEGYVATYSTEGHLIREEHLEGGGLGASVATYEYSETGLLLVETSTRAGGSTTTSTFEYDDEDRVVRKVEVVATQEEGTYATEETYEYDGDLLLTTTKDVSQDGDVDSVEQRTYDSEGRLVRVETRDASGTLTFVREQEYEGETLIHNRLDVSGDGDWDQETVQVACD